MKQNSVILLSKRYNNDGKAVLKLDSLQVETRHEIESKIAKGIYKFEQIPCCICSNKQFESLSNKDRYGMYLPVVICKNCGLIQTNPRMDEKSYNSFYKNEYRKLHRGKKQPSEDFFSGQYWRGKLIHRFLTGANLLPATPDDSVVLEVGCGAGGILQAFKEKGVQVQGIDLGEEYLEYGRLKHGLNLHVCSIKDLVLEKSPDIIIYSHVLEHVVDLKQELRNIHRSLSPDGIVYIELPGVKYLTHYCEMDFLRTLQYAHTYYFTLTTLRNLLENNGFGFVTGDESIKSVFRKSKLISPSLKIKNDYESVILYLNRIEKFGKFYFFSPYKLKLMIKKVLSIFGLRGIVSDIYRKIKDWSYFA